MPRAKGTARCGTETGGPFRPINRRFQYLDHAGYPYTVVCHRWGMSPESQKLSLQLYCLGSFTTSPEELGEKLIDCKAFENSNYRPRVDVYTGCASIEECIEHHRREKGYREQAVYDMRKAAVEGLSEEEGLKKLLKEVRGKQPLPHIVPTWCESEKFWEGSPHRYRSWILVIGEDCYSWEDVKHRGILQVKFDLDVTPDMETEQVEYLVEDDTCLDGEEDGWVWVNWTYAKRCKPVGSRLLCLRDDPHPHVNQTEYFYANNCRYSWQTPGSERQLWHAWFEATEVMPSDCAYRSGSCDDCYDCVPHSECENELSEHYFDHDGQCIACRREEERREDRSEPS